MISGNRKTMKLYKTKMTMIWVCTAAAAFEINISRNQIVVQMVFLL